MCQLDLEREERIGLSEAIFCYNKLVDQISTILDKIIDKDVSFLFTRLSHSKYQGLSIKHQNFLDYDPISQTGFINFRKTLNPKIQVSVITAGTSDISVSKEVVRTLKFYGFNCLEINDVGVAGIWRLMERVDEIQQMPIVIVIAGMDAALASVVGGLVNGVVIAVPTSTGYGVCREGESALHSMLVSCAPGITVVNIDNGYGAACSAIRQLNMLEKYCGRNGK